MYDYQGAVVGLVDLQLMDDYGRTGMGAMIGMEYACDFVSNSLASKVATHESGQ